MEKAENTGNGDCSRTNSTECKGCAREQSTEKPESGETEVREPGLLEAILDRGNLNRAYKRVKANKGAPGADGMTVEEALPWLVAPHILCKPRLRWLRSTGAKLAFAPLAAN